MSGRTIGIDMGTKQLKVYRQGKGVVFDQENVVAIERKKKVLAIGDEAADMVDKAPDDIEVVYPMQHGVVANINSMIQLLNKCWKGMFFNPKWVLKIFENCFYVYLDYHIGFFYLSNC